MNLYILVDVTTGAPAPKDVNARPGSSGALPALYVSEADALRAVSHRQRLGYGGLEPRPATLSVDR